MTLGEWLDQWLEELVAPSVRESTLEGHRHHIQYHIKPRLGSKPISKITPDDVRKLYRDVQNHGHGCGRNGVVHVEHARQQQMHAFGMQVAQIERKGYAGFREVDVSDVAGTGRIIVLQ